MTKQVKLIGMETDGISISKKELIARFTKDGKGETLSIGNDTDRMFSVNMADIRRLIAE